MAIDLQNPVHLIMRKTLYLDFDGVLHPNLSTQAQWFVHLDKFCNVLRSVPHVASIGDTAEQALHRLDIVISSSWRFRYNLAELVDFFPRDVQPLIVGTTGPAFVGRYARWEEIRQHAHAQRVGDWRALDDSAYEFPRGCCELILCNGAVGLDERQLTGLALWLSS